MSKYNKLDKGSKYNTYPFVTCPLCGLTFSIMGDDEPKQIAKEPEKVNRVDDGQITFLEDEDYDEGDMYGDNEYMPEIENIDFFFLNSDDDIEIENLFATTEECYNEKEVHHKHHLRYEVAKKKYGNNLMTYEERCEFFNGIYPILKNPEANAFTKKILLDNLCQLRFTESVEMTDFSTTHPTYDKFLKYLLATQWFIDEISPYINNEVIEELRRKYNAGKIGEDGLRKNLTWWT